jgi:hypothetical protein
MGQEGGRTGRGGRGWAAASQHGQQGGAGAGGCGRPCGGAAVLPACAHWVASWRAACVQVGAPQVNYREGISRGNEVRAPRGGRGRGRPPFALWVRCRLGCRDPRGWPGAQADLACLRAPLCAARVDPLRAQEAVGRQRAVRGRGHPLRARRARHRLRVQVGDQGAVTEGGDGAVGS